METTEQFYIRIAIDLCDKGWKAGVIRDLQQDCLVKVYAPASTARDLEDALHQGNELPTAKVTGEGHGTFTIRLRSREELENDKTLAYAQGMAARALTASTGQAIENPFHQALPERGAWDHGYAGQQFPISEIQQAVNCRCTVTPTPARDEHLMVDEDDYGSLSSEFHTLEERVKNLKASATATPGQAAAFRELQQAAMHLLELLDAKIEEMGDME